MFKRAFWLTTGAGFGFGMSLWVQRTVKRTAARYSPQRFSGELTKTVKGISGDVRAAVQEGREAMREREAALRGVNGSSTSDTPSA
jgi:gas vesicle protein